MSILKNSIKDRILLTIWLLITLLCATILYLSPENPLLSLAALLPKGWLPKIALVLLLISIGLTISLFILYRKQVVKINSKTCEWIQNPGIWKHKTNDLHYCPRCAPNPSPLSTDNDKNWFCPKCSGGFGEGAVFTVSDDYD